MYTTFCMKDVNKNEITVPNNTPVIPYLNTNVTDKQYLIQLQILKQF